MLLIDDHQPKVLKRQEKCRPRADDQPRLALRHHPPEPPPLGHRDARVPFRRPRPEPRLDPRQELRRQGDLRQEDQRLPPAAQTFRHRLQVHFGLPRPRHPFQERRRIPPQRHRGHQRIPRRDLIALQPHALARIEPRVWRVPRRILLGHHPQLHQPLHD